MHPRFKMSYKSYGRAYYKRCLKEKNKIKAILAHVSYFNSNPLQSSHWISKLSVKYLNDSLKIFFINCKQRFPKTLLFFNEPVPIEVVNQKQVLNRQNTVVNFLVILHKRKNTFLSYLKNFEKIFLKKREIVNLIVIYFPKSGKLDKRAAKKTVNSDNETTSSTGDLNMIQFKIKKLQRIYPERTIKFINMKDVPFCKTIGLQKAENEVKNPNEILFFCDVDMLFSSSALLWHLRQNTIQGKRVYYLVTFSEYDPKVVHKNTGPPKSRFEYRMIDGFWRYFGFGMFSIYKSDFMRTNGFDTRICGWGLEDMEMVCLVFQNSHI